MQGIITGQFKRPCRLGSWLAKPPGLYITALAAPQQAIFASAGQLSLRSGGTECLQPCCSSRCSHASCAAPTMRAGAACRARPARSTPRWAAVGEHPRRAIRNKVNIRTPTPTQNFNRLARRPRAVQWKDIPADQVGCYHLSELNLRDAFDLPSARSNSMPHLGLAVGTGPSTHPPSGDIFLVPMNAEKSRAIVNPRTLR